MLQNAEVTCYLMLIQKAQAAGGIYLNAIDPLSQNMKDEQVMINMLGELVCQKMRVQNPTKKN